MFNPGPGDLSSRLPVRMLRHLFLIAILCAGLPSLAQQRSTYVYAIKDSALQLDFYTDRNNAGHKRPCVLFVFGGAFVGGHRDDTLYNRYFTSLVSNNYRVASISYRLGMKGVRKIGPLHTAPLMNAVTMAVEDVYDATNWLIRHADSLGIDTSKIILSGSSSGAVTALESDFMKRNEKAEAKVLPIGFNYAAVIAFSGAILSYDGKLKYKSPPAPVFLFHGTADRIVPYNKIKLFRKGLYGSSYIAKTYKKKGYPFSIFRVKDMGHEISLWPMYAQLPAILEFLQQFMIEKKRYQSDLLFKDPDAKPVLTISAKELFNKLSK